MKILVLHGQKHKGSTWNVTRLFLEKLVTESDEVDEFFVNDLPDCCGCFTCILRDEAKCPHRDVYGPIIEAFEAADVVVAETPNYCFGMTGQLKTFLDHMAYRWIPHRPLPAMQRKVGVVICTTAGSGAGTAARQVARQLFWMGVPKTYRYALGVQASCWEDVQPVRKSQAEKHTERLAGRVRKKLPGVHRGIRQWFLFQIMGFMQSKDMGNPTDKAYWQANGWIK